MKNCLALTLCAICVIVISGCGPVQQGNHILDTVKHEELKVKLKEGVTTTEDVRSMFGDPAETQIRLDGLEEWTYELLTSQVAGFSVDTNMKTLRVLFDKKGALVRYVYSSSKGGSRRNAF